MEKIYDGNRWNTLAYSNIEAWDRIDMVDSRYLEPVKKDMHSVQLGEGDFRVPNWSYLNHSCQPNSKIVALSEHVFALIATEFIAAEDEITFDYRTTESTISAPFQCECPSDSCVGFLTK